MVMIFWYLDKAKKTVPILVGLTPEWSIHLSAGPQRDLSHLVKVELGVRRRPRQQFSVYDTVPLQAML